jgi:large subunit ribosomal protein L30
MKTDNTIRVKWVRSGIGFSHRQKVMIRSLGLSRLNQVVERPDTPQTRGLVAGLAHLVEIVTEPQQPAWASVPEYIVCYEPCDTGHGERTETTPGLQQGSISADASAPKEQQVVAATEPDAASATVESQPTETGNE